MNSQGYFFRCWGSLLTTLLIGLGASQAADVDLHERISRALIFPQPLLWVGEQAPSEPESAALWAALQMESKTNRVSKQIERLEKFISDYPASPWTPSARANLAVYYRQSGRYSLALQHWEMAWNACKQFDSGSGRKVNDYVLAEWSTLLSSLGRVEKLKELHAANAGRVLCDLEWERKFKASEATLQLMQRDPGISFRCGTLALMAVGIASKARFDVNALKDLPSPETGFSLAQLVELADQHKLNLVPVHRSSASNLVVPSVILS